MTVPGMGQGYATWCFKPNQPVQLYQEEGGDKVMGVGTMSMVVASTVRTCLTELILRSSRYAD